MILTKPLCVNLIAFLTKLIKIYLSRNWSPINNLGKGAVGIASKPMNLSNISFLDSLATVLNETEVPMR